METPPEVFPPDDLPRPSRPKAGLGLVTIMMRMAMITIKRSDEYHEYAAVVILLFDKPTSQTLKPSIKYVPGLSFFSLLLWLISSVRQIFAKF